MIAARWKELMGVSSPLSAFFVIFSFNFLPYAYVVSLCHNFRMNNRWKCSDKRNVNTNRKQVPIIESIYVSYLFIMDASDPISPLGNEN